MGVLDVLQQIFAPNHAAIQQAAKTTDLSGVAKSGTAVDYIPKIVNNNGKNSAAGGTSSGKGASGKGSSFSDFWSAIKAAGQEAGTSSKYTSTPSAVAASKAAANVSVDSAFSPANQKLITVGTDMRNRVSSDIQAVKDANTPKTGSTIKNPTKIVTVDMPKTGDEKKDKILGDFCNTYTGENTQAWIEKYIGKDLDSSMEELKKQINKAPNKTNEDLVARAQLIAEYQFLEAVKNYGVYMDYNLQAGKDKVSEMDDQIDSLKKKISQYEDIKSQNDTMAWNVANDPEYAEAKSMSEKDYEQAKADLAALEQYRKDLHNEVRDARNVQFGSIVADFAASPEFEQYAKMGAMKEGNERFEKSGGNNSLFSYMEDDEAKMYDALYAAGGKETADKYLDYLEDTLEMRQGQAIAKDVDNIKSDFWQSQRAAVFGLNQNMAGSVKGLWSAITGKEKDLSARDYALGYIREDLGEMNSGLNSKTLPAGANASQLLFDAMSSFGNMAPSLIAAAAIGKIPGLQGQAAQLVGSAVMFGGVYGNVKDEMVKAGYNEKSASTYAALNAASEVALEKVLGGFEALGGAAGLPILEKSLGNISNAYLRYAATMGVKMMGEGTEEYLQDVIDPIFRNYAFSEKNEVNVISEEGMYSYLVAALSVFGSESIGTYVNVSRCEAAGAYLNAVRNANPELYDTLLNAALDSKNSDIQELAEGLKSGEYKPTNGNVGELLLEMARDSRLKGSAQELILQSAAHLGELKIGAIQTDARAKAQEDWDALVMQNPGKKVLDPVASALLEKTGWDEKTAEEQGTILAKIFSGVVPTSREIDALDVNNIHVQEIFRQYTGLDISDVVNKDGVKSRIDLAAKVKEAAKNAADTETYQQALKEGNKRFIEQRTDMLMKSEFAPRVEKASEEALKGTDIQMGKPGLSKKGRAAPSVIPPAAKSTDGLAGMDKNSFVKAYMEKHNVSRAKAEEAWKNRSAHAEVLYGGNENGEQVRSDSAGRVDDLAGRDSASGVHDGTAGSDAGNAARAEGGESEGVQGSNGAAVNGRVIPVEEYNDEQKTFVEGCKKDGFSDVELIDGPLMNEAGQILNAKVDPKTGKLTISASDPTTMQKVARHERVHLWLSRRADSASFVRNMLRRIVPDQKLEQLFVAYDATYSKAYARKLDPNSKAYDPVGYINMVFEEILCDMFGGMFNYGVDAGSYYNTTTKLITDSRIREDFLEKGPQMAESETQASTENVEETPETATENVEPAIDIDKAVAETMGVDEEPSLEELLAEAEEEEGTYHQKDGYWQDPNYYSVAEDTPRQGPSFLSPFKADINQTIPPDTRPFPGEPPMHEGMDRMSVASMAQGANFELKLNSAGYPYQVIDKATGKPVTEVTPEMMVDTPMGNLIQMAMTDGSLKDLSDDEKIEAAKQQYKMLADAMNLIVKYDDAALVWELVGSQMFSAIKSNSDTQYNRTIDFSTICKKTQAIVNAMSETMKQLNRGLTRREVEAVYLETGKAGESTPCPVCYVFSRWMGIGNLLDQINRFQTRFADMDEAEIVTFMEQIEEDAHAYAEEQIKKAKDPEKKRKSFYDKNGEFKLGKVLSSMKPNSAESAAIKALSAHQQATARIAELEAAMETATPEQQTEYKKWIKSLKKLTLSEKKLAATQQKLETADAEIERFEAYQWLASTLMMKGQKIENGRSVFDENGEAVNVWQKNPRFKPVPGDVLFDLNKGAEFADKYPLTWAFRTGKGCAMGKAITPYADARVGETIQGVAGGIKDIRVSEMAVDDEGFLRPVENKDVNEFLNDDTKKQKATLASAIKNMKRQNLIGGMRYQSTSDFRYEYGSDYLMTFFEMQAMGANVQLYTKVIEAVDFLASTGADCNLSLMPLADGYKINPETGKKELVFSDVTGINHQAAVAKAKQYDNVQCILVGINDENILLALESEDVTFVIPFHGSGQSVHQIQTLMDMLGEHLDVMQAEDYTSVQSDREIPNRAEEHPELQAMWDLRMDIIMGNLQDGVTEEQSRLLDQNPHLQKLYDMFYVNKNDPAYQNFLAKDQAKQIFPYEYWDKTTTYETADRNGEIFKSYCESMGVVPRFSGKNSKNQDTGFGNFAYGGENGQCVKGYWKLLIDRKMYKNVYDEAGNWTGYGEYREQQQINMSNVKLENLDPKWGKANFTEKEMSKPIDTTKTEDIVAKSIKAIETLRATGDIFDRTAVTPNARKILTETQLNRQPTSAELLKQESAKPQERANKAEPMERASVAEEESVPTSEEIQTDARTDNGDERFSIATDQEYEDALVNDPETAQWMVDQAAKAAGYNRRAFHGTTHQFWTFARGKEGIHFGTIEQAEDTLKKDQDRSQFIKAPITQVLDDLESYDEEDRAAISQSIEMLYMTPGFDPMRNFPTTPSTYDETSPKDIRKYAKKVLSLYTKDPRLLTIEAPNPDAKGGRIIDAYIKMQHPMTIPVDLGYWSPSVISGALLDALDNKTSYYLPRNSMSTEWHPAEDIKGIELTEADRPALEKLRSSRDFAELARFLRSKGVDSIEYINTVEGPEDAPSYLLLNPEQVKLADVATYDDNGDLIPLSERFNSMMGDMRYSVADTEVPLTEAQEKNKSFNEAKTEVGSPLKTLQGTTIKRYKNVAGKEVSPQVYVHKDYAAEVVPKETLDAAEAVLKEKYPDFTYNTIMYDKKSGVVRFDEAPDFDTAREPIAGHTVSVTPSGATKTGYSDSIWHHKWLWVGNDYKGFNVEDSWNWSKQWLNTIRPVGADIHKFNSSFSQKGIANGTGHGTANWNEQLDYFGLPHDENSASGREVEERYSVALSDPVFDSPNRKEPITDSYGSTFYITPSDGSWTVEYDDKGNLLNTDYLRDTENGRGFKVFDNPTDALRPGQRQERKWSGSTMKGQGTQIAQTQGTYKQIGDQLIKLFGEDRAKKLRILDASSGLGFGSQALMDMGFENVTDLEPFPPPDGSYVPHYTKYGDLIADIENGTEAPFDIVISNAVINVMAQDARAEIVAALGKFVAPDGHIFINTFGKKNVAAGYPTLNDEAASLPGDKRPSIELQPDTGKTGREAFIKQSKSIQKAFYPNELKGFVRDVLHQTGSDGFTFSGTGGLGINSTWVDMDGRSLKAQAADTGERYSIQTLDDGTQYVKLDGNIFQREDGSQMTPTEAYDQLVDGTPITTADGDTITFVRRLPDRSNMANEVFRKRAAAEEGIDHVEMTDTVNKNLVELLQASKATDRNQPQRHPHRGIQDFDERTVYMADDNNAYKLTMAIANTDDGQKVMYAKKYVSAEPDLLNKIKEAETGRKRPVNQPNDTVPQTESDVNTERASVANEESKETKAHFPKNSLEDKLFGLMSSESIEDAEKWLNQMREKNEEGKAAKSAKPVIPRANKAVPVGEEQRKAQRQVMQEKIDEYGEIPSGEKAARETHTPNKTGPDDYVRRFVRTAKEAKATPERMVDQIDADLLGNDALTYARITDTKAVAAADREYDARGYQALKNEWNGIARVDKMPSKYDIALGERLYIEAARQGDDAFALRTLADVAAMGTAAGQVVQAMRLLKKMGPVGQLYYFQKAVDRMNAQNKGRIAKGSMQPIHLNQELAQQVLLAESQKEIEDAMKALIKDTANQLPVTLKDKWDAWRYLAMLGNPRTHIRNVFGNAVFWPIRFTKDLLAAAGENIFLKDEQRTKSAAFLLNSGKYKDIRAFAASDFESMKKEITGSGKLNPVNEILQARDIFKGLGILDKLSEKNSEWLEKEDVIFLRNAYINSMSQYLVARGLTAADLTKDSRELNQARQYAALEAQKATYRDFSMVASALNRLKDIPVAGQLIDGLMPFTKTPMNILKRGIEYSPIGLMKSISYDLMKVKQGDMTAAEAIDHFAAGMTGTMIAALGWLLAAHGLARGSDDDDKKKADLEKTQGHQAYSLEIDGMSFTIDWMAPVALPFFVGVEAFNQVTEGGTPNFYDFADAMTLILEPMMSLSMLDGVNSVLSAAAYAENNAVQSVATTMLTSYISQGLPTIGAQLARTIDTDRRATYVDKNNPAPGWLQRFVQQNEGKIPGVAQNKMAYVDMWGRKDNAGGLAMRALENFIFPWYQNEIRENPVEHELMRLAKATGDNEVLPSYISKSFTVDGETIDLTADQYEKLKMVTGKESLKLLGEIMSTPAYASLDDAEKTKMIKNAMTITSTLGRQAIREDYKPAAWVQRAIDNDNYEAAVTFHVMQSMETGLSNYQLIECMYWLTPEEQGKLITSQYTPQAKMTDYTQKKHKFILDDDMKARSREIYEELFWQEYPQLTASQKWVDADIAGRAEMVKKLQTDVGKAARSAYGDELRAQGIVSVYLDDPDEEAEEIAAVLNEFGYEP